MLAAEFGWGWRMPLETVPAGVYMVVPGKASERRAPLTGLVHLGQRPQASKQSFSFRFYLDFLFFMWNLLDQGFEPISSVLAGGFLSTRKVQPFYFDIFLE